MASGGSRWLNRGNTRDVVLVLCVASVVLTPHPGWQAIPAAILLAAGTALHVLVKGTLIRNQMLCRMGPYRLARHPYYLANYLVDCSFCLLTANPYLLTLLPFLFFWGYGPSLRSEEARLWELHPGDHARFMGDTPQLFPDGTDRPSLRTLWAVFSVRRMTANELRRVVRFWGVFAGLLALQWGMAAIHAGATLAEAWRRPAVQVCGVAGLALLVVAQAPLRKRRAAAASPQPKPS